VVAADFLELQRELCDRFHPLPSVPLFGVTGTNGKTTTVELLLQLARMGGKRGVSIGTLGVRDADGEREDFGMTTPGYLQLRQLLHRHAPRTDFFVMEASSHALDQDRLYGLLLAGAAWTSFTRDHLDYHGDMESYARAKEKIFDKLAPGACVYVPSTQTDLLHRLRGRTGLRPATLPSVAEDRLPLYFRTSFNRENLACAWGLAEGLGVTAAAVDWEQLRPPPGRFHVREWQGRIAVVDFAHTADAIDNVCRAIKESFPRHRLVVLFGCGGDRDRGKRPLMGAAAAKWADRIVVTSDNPRSEDPQQIIADIRGGLSGHADVQEEPDRRRAVRSALASLADGEILLMAGKGHENTIQIGERKIPYSDIEELELFLGNHDG
jgi:UDP-N-acetylmuramoyl-L-alanyl-D-glutamate--2,6-diaminopimelate ligase